MSVDLEMGIIDAAYAEALTSLAVDADYVKEPLLKRNAKSEVRRLIADFPGLGGVAGINSLSICDRDRFNIGAGCFAAALYIEGPGGRDVLARMTEYRSGRVTKKWDNLERQSPEKIAQALRDEAQANLEGIEGAGTTPVPFALIALSGAAHLPPGGEPKNIVDQMYGPPYGGWRE